MLALAALLAASALTLAPAKAQTPGPPASIEISEPLGSLNSFFQLTATVTAAGGNPVAGAQVEWSAASVADLIIEPGRPPRIVEAAERRIWLAAVKDRRNVSEGVEAGTTTWDGKTHALYLATGGAGMVAVTAKVRIYDELNAPPSFVASATRLLHVTGGRRESPFVYVQPPIPASFWLIGTPDTVRTAGQFVVTARITDANLALVPDGTPVAWEMDAAHGVDAVFTPISVERETANGMASATYAVTSTPATVLFTESNPRDGQTDEWREIGPHFPVLATVRVDGVSFTQLVSVPLAWPVATGVITLTSSAPSWKLLKSGETFTVTATVTDADGAAVSDGTAISWIASSANFSPHLVLVSADTQTMSGSASATYRVSAHADRISFVSASTDDLTGYLQVRVDNVGSYPEPPDDLALSLRLPADSDNIIPTDSTLQVAATLTYTGRARELYVSDGALRIAGAQEWESGRGRLPVPSQAVTLLDRLDLDALSRYKLVGQLLTSWSTADPDTCKGVSVDGQTDWTCAVKLDDATIHIPAGTPDGTFTISGVITVNGREYRDTLEVSVVAPNTIDEVAEVQFDFAEQERGANRGEPYPANVPVGGETKFRLKILNENGVASAAGSIGSILLTTSAGSLSTRIGGGCVGGGGAACQIPVSAVTAANADQIDVILTHPGPNKSGRGEVRANVLAIDGETFAPPALNVSFAGEVASLTISEPASSLLRAATDADDNRDMLKLTVSAADAAGNDVEVPYRAPRATIRDPEGKVVASGISVVWTEDGDDSDDAHDRFTRNIADAVEATIRVTATAAATLKLGVYTLELRTAGLSATREFTVVGEADSVALSEPEGELRVNGVVSFTATLRDAEGNPAPDGTPVAWAERSTGQSAVLVRLAAGATTTDGASTATFFAVGAGTAVVSAESGGVSEVALLSIAAAPPAGGAPEREPQLGESLSTQGAPGLATWLGESATSASALLDALSGIDAIQLWSIDRWLRYSRGADDFVIQPGTVLWLSG